jgi:3-hydroxy-9,10-secoandrosta-1,3,5(10)-triene-9,17-dione monooxygenase reductase component
MDLPDVTDKDVESGVCNTRPLFVRSFVNFDEPELLEARTLPVRSGPRKQLRLARHGRPLHPQSGKLGQPVMSTIIDDFDPIAFRNTLGHYASGITIISGIDETGPQGFTCQSFYSVSIDPPLVSFSVMKNSNTYPRIRQTDSFAVNVLSQHQHKVSNQFARKGSDRWAGIPWTSTRAGNPVIEDTLMWLDSDIWAEHDAGDHLIVVGKVKEMSQADWHVHEPLLYFKGKYRYLRQEEDLV